MHARLDSRQRKKQHTERLEEEKKHYTNIISELEDACAQLRIREADHARREEEWKAQQQRYEHFIEGLQLEKEEMIRRHTIETGDLRKKNAVLAEHVQKMDGTAMSAMPSSSGFSADFSDVDGLGLGFGVESGSFEPYSILHDFSLVPDLAPRPDQSLALVSQPRKSEHMPPPPPPPPPPPADNRHDLLDEKPAASGFLLLVCSPVNGVSFRVSLLTGLAPALRCLCRVEKLDHIDPDHSPVARGYASRVRDGSGQHFPRRRRRAARGIGSSGVGPNRSP